MTRILAADIGGTNSRFGHFESIDGGGPRLIKSTWLNTKQASSFPMLLDQLKESKFSLLPADAELVVIAAAGPVTEGVYCTPPLIEWDIDLSNALKEFGISKFSLINDFLAQGAACCSPIAAEADQIIPGEASKDGAIAVIGAGTGLGKAIIFRDGRGGFITGPSEGGHVNFSPQNEEEFKFQNFMCQRYEAEYLTWNSVVSGQGLSDLHLFLSGEQLSPKEVAAGFSPDSKTLNWAARFYGRVCRNFALETLSTGGMYVAGGVAAKNPILVSCDIFRKEFQSSRTHSPVLNKIPVYLLDNQDSGLWGAAYYGWQSLRE